MKRWFDYTDEELLQIYTSDTETFKKLVDLECAHAGVPIDPPTLRAEPVFEEVTPDLRLYRVGGFLFEDAYDANDLLEILRRAKLWKTVYDHSMRYAVELKPGDYEYPNVVDELVNSEELHLEIVSKKKLMEEKKLQWKEQFEKHTAIVTSREAATAPFYERIDFLLARENRKKLMLAKYKYYLELAEGNRKVALNFLEKIEPEFVKEFPEFFEMDSENE